MLISRRAFGWGVAALATLGGFQAHADDADWPNVFISPCGQPFRAKPGAPYPVVDWFKQVDKNADGKIDRAEFVADAEAFFKVLDVNKDGVIDSYEVEIYEHNIAPEVLGYTVNVGALDHRDRRQGARLWLAQVMPQGEDQSDDSDSKPTGPIDEIPQGAGPYGLIEVPEPITSADTDFNGIIRKVNFLKLADRRFTTLDTENRGFLTLDKLPKTYVQKRMKKRGGGFHL
jgi:hypothetical protein